MHPHLTTMFTIVGILASGWAFASLLASAVLWIDSRLPRRGCPTCTRRTP